MRLNLWKKVSVISLCLCLQTCRVLEACSLIDLLTSSPWVVTLSWYGELSGRIFRGMCGVCHGEFSERIILSKEMFGGSSGKTLHTGGKVLEEQSRIPMQDYKNLYGQRLWFVPPWLAHSLWPVILLVQPAELEAKSNTGVSQQFLGSALRCLGVVHFTAKINNEKLWLQCLKQHGLSGRQPVRR